jgi:hypothetical protein
MADVRCPVCGKPNPEGLALCRFCGSELKPASGSNPGDSKAIKPGEEPTKRDTSEFEKVNLNGVGPIHAGEAPTKKNTAELEKSLPTWLRNLREEKRPVAGESMPEPSGENQPADSKAKPGQDSSAGSSDWLTGLGKAASSEEEAVPDWLAGLRAGKPTESATTAPAEEEPASGLSDADWLTRLGNEPKESAPTPVIPAETPLTEGSASDTTPESGPEYDTPDWLKDMQSQQSSGQKPPAAPQAGDNLPEWLSGLPGLTTESGAAPTGGSAASAAGEPAPAEDLPDWLGQLEQKSNAQQPGAPVGGTEPAPDWLTGLGSVPETPASTPAGGTEPAPDWLSGLGSVPETPASTPAGTEPAPDWLSGLGSVPETPASTPAGTGPAPDWLSGLGSAPETPASASAENLPDWLSNPKANPAEGTGITAPAFSSEPTAANIPASETPDWLSQLKSDVNSAQEAVEHKDEFSAASEVPAIQKGTGPLPDWLSGIERTTPASGSTPALVSDNKEITPAEQGEAAFALETPDWLTKLTPDQAGEKAAGTNEGQPEPENLEAGELPSWVQAMRPVESVVESKTALLQENQTTEQTGPLAGLRGVLPTEPGLGVLRKPPAYSTKLHVSEGQQRYASYLDRLVAGETNPRAAKTKHLTSNQLLRWLITVLLLLAVALPFVSGAKVAPATTLESSDKGASSTIISGLTGKVPVLVAFDYDPALSGELEAVAAPLMDQLLAKGVPLGVISTSPTGPALAEHFLQTTSLVNVYQYKSGVQYADLGYLAGGPAGIIYFADAPTNAVTTTLDGQPAWSTGPLQGIQKLSDFAAVIILTDNADTGRNWIEQAGPLLGKTPMLMMISAQAEPMIQPYYDSGQLKGLVSGLSDAKIYEQKYNRPGLANQYWDSFSIGMLVAELLIVIGAILGVVMDWRARHKASGEGA